MERIDTQQPSKKTIPAICETDVQAVTDDSTIGSSAINWLSTAMAIWMRDDDAPKRKHAADNGLNAAIS